MWALVDVLFTCLCMVGVLKVHLNLVPRVFQFDMHEIRVHMDAHICYRNFLRKSRCVPR